MLNFVVPKTTDLQKMFLLFSSNPSISVAVCKKNIFIPPKMAEKHTTAMCSLKLETKASRIIIGIGLSTKCRHDIRNPKLSNSRYSITKFFIYIDYSKNVT